MNNTDYFVYIISVSEGVAPTKWWALFSWLSSLLLWLLCYYPISSFCSSLLFPLLVRRSPLIQCTLLPALIWWLRDFGVGGLLESNLGLQLRPSTATLRGGGNATDCWPCAGVSGLRSALAKLFVWPSSYFYSREARSKKPLVYIRYQEIDFSLELFWMLSFLSVLSSLERRYRGGKEALFSAFLSFN